MEEKIGKEPRWGRENISPEELRAQVEDYIAQCSEQGVFPDLAGMRLFLGLDRQEMEKLGSDAPYRESLNYAADCRESWLARKMTEDNKLSSACYNALKESCNGGWSDKGREAKQRLVIEFTGNISPEDFL